LAPSFTPHLAQREPRWQTATIARWQVPTQLKPWLQGRGSLTTELLVASAGVFRVEVLSQALANIYPSEQQLLGLKSGQRALVREVILFGCGQPWVFARSVLPLSTLTGRLRALRRLDNRPLGHHLFSYANMRRSEIELALIGRRERYLPAAYRTHNQSQWGRRSVFHLDNKPLLVSEVFLNSFCPNGQPIA
jgi:chorismate--pyruvate lyase